MLGGLRLPVRRVLVCGDRNWADLPRVKRELEWLLRENGGPFVVVEGGASGADELARAVALVLGLEVATYAADWSQGKRAGPMRNERMLKEGRPDYAIAFHSDLERSKGTKDMVRRLRKAGIPVKIVR